MKTFTTAFFSLLIAVASLAQEKPGAATAAAETPEPGLYATLDTSMGRIVLRLLEKESPKTVENFVALATGKKPWRDYATGKTVTAKPFYEGIIFHRVIPGFMIQAGAHLADGGAHLAAPIPDEFSSGLSFDRPGRLAMANAGPNTGSSQFFITHVPTPHLDGKHTIFGQVVKGQDVVVALGNVPRDAQDKPRTPVTINKVTVERVGPEPVTKPK
ncbi:MAG: peptidylprolyl isomerase [Acidobacteria bacterium]|nr:peptidylprolyl isomerase [Acidobacteriota bacterium]